MDREGEKMTFFPIFLSIVVVARNQASSLRDIISSIASNVGPRVTDFEVIVVENGSDDNSIETLRALTSEHGLPNLQVFVLTKQVDSDTAAFVGLENSLGDFVLIFDPLTDDISYFSEMMEKSVSGCDVVFANNKLKPQQSLAYRFVDNVFNRIFWYFMGVHLSKEAPSYRLLSKRVVNFILRHRQPALTYRHVPVTGGFSRTNLEYQFQTDNRPAKNLRDGIDKGMRLLTSTTRTPMRIVTTLSLFGAIANLVYSIYVVAIAIFKTDVAPGWTSLSLQQSGMFFLVSLVLLVLGEYILQMASLSNEGPLVHIAQEFTSTRTSRGSKLNIETPHPDRVV